MIGFVASYLLSLLCPTPIAWVEKDAYGQWFPMCADEDGIVDIAHYSGTDGIVRRIRENVVQAHEFVWSDRYRIADPKAFPYHTGS